MNNRHTPKHQDQLQGHFTDARLATYKKAGLYAYSVVILLVLVAMVYLLNSAADEPEVETAQITEDEILAVLNASNGSVSVPISNIEALLPVAPPTPAWRHYAAAWKTEGPKKIAIVIDDLGLDQNVSKQLTLFQGPLTLAFLPYADQLQQQTSMLRRNGHEIMVHLPMEPKDGNADPGPNALLSSVSYDEFERRIEWNLNRFDGFVGINNHMGSALTEDAGRMVRVMVHLRRKGYLFLDSLTSARSVGERAAIATGVPHMKRDVFLDNERNIASILAQLEKTEKIAGQRGYAIAIGHPYPETMKALQFWSARLDKSAFSLVPISQLVADQNKVEKMAEVQSR